MTLRTSFFFLFTFLTLFAGAQIPTGYYNNANGKTGVALQQALHDIIGAHTQVSYSELWTHFQQSDKTESGKVWDIYSDLPGGTPPYTFTFVTNQCGSYSKEGDCYNREHTFCQSWFREGCPLYTDMFHLYPTDGYVNGKRGNYPFGEVGSASWTSKNGSRLGDCASAGYTGTVFEPLDEYKGDIARGFFYVATRYYGEDSGFPGSDMVNGSQLKPWAKTLMMQWAQLDPVSQKEIDRNNIIYNIQHNRNPFIDHPEYLNQIWGTGTGFSDHAASIALPLYPNPVAGVCSVTLPESYGEQKISYLVYNTTGLQVQLPGSVSGARVTFDVSSLPPGVYCIIITPGQDEHHYTARFIKK